jgi:predicted RNA binding protein YcfA (HicA-like mRNA interferase family)
MKVKDVIRLLEGEGWILIAMRGSHRQYKHPVRPGRVTVAGKPSDGLRPAH